MKQKEIFIHSFPTPLGPMIAIGEEKVLYLVDFKDRKNLKKGIDSLIKKTLSTLITKDTKSTLSVEKELGEYFRGNRKTFSTSFTTSGSFFQKAVWQAIETISYGTKSSYLGESFFYKRIDPLF